MSFGMVKQKLFDHGVEEKLYIENMAFRVSSLVSGPLVYTEFKKEMGRFLPFHLVKKTIESTDFWNYLCNTIKADWKVLKEELKEKGPKSIFVM